MTSRRLLCTLAVLAMCFAAYTPNLFAQGSDLGTIRGLVTDSSGALVTKAQVQITNLDNLRVYSYKTDARGELRCNQSDSWTVQGRGYGPGFETSVITGIVLNGSDVSQQNAVLHPASQTVNVQVTSEAVGIDTEDSTISQTLNSTAVVNLPRDSRDINIFSTSTPASRRATVTAERPSFFPHSRPSAPRATASASHWMASATAAASLVSRREASHRWRRWAS